MCSFPFFVTTATEISIRLVNFRPIGVMRAAHEPAFDRTGLVSMRLPPPRLFNKTPSLFWGLVLRDLSRILRTPLPLLLVFEVSLANLSSPVWALLALYIWDMAHRTGKVGVSVARDSVREHTLRT